MGGVKERSADSIAASLGKLSARWLDPKYIFRRKSVKRLVRISGFSEKMSEAMMDAVFGELTATKLRRLLKAEFKDPRVLDGFREEKGSGVQLRVRGPETILHIFAANAPQAPVLSFVLGMLLKSRNVGKLSSRDGGFLDIYLQSLKTADHALWSGNTLIGPGDRRALSFHMKKAGLVAAYGSDESLDRIRREVPASTPFFGYGHRVSAALYLKEVLRKKNAPRLAVLAAQDVWMADQRGCLSPVVIYAQKGGQVSPGQFSAQVAGELQRLQNREKNHARRNISSDVAAYGLRNKHLLQKIKGDVSVLWESRPRGLWAVAYEENLKPFFGASQTIAVKGYQKTEQALAALKSVQRYLQCVSLECAPGDRKETAERLSVLGVNRICRAGKMQIPPATWHHDGKPALASWVRWTDLE